MDKYILGGGIAGLIAKHYNPDYKIISPDLGGQLTKSKNIMITFYVHDHELNRQLLDELKIKYTPRKIKIFYYYDKKVLTNIDNKLRIKFIKSKMVEWNYDANSVDVEDLNLSTSNDNLDILDVDINQLITKLKPKPADIINAKVKLINNNRKFILLMRDDKLQILDYDKLISTIPANDFFFMLYNYKSNYHFNYLPTTYVLSSSCPDFYNEDGLYYVNDKRYIYNRVQKYSSGYVYEITGLVPDEILNREISNIIQVERRYVGLVRDENVDDFSNIKFLGRLAEWKHHIKIQDNISKALELRGLK